MKQINILLNNAIKPIMVFDGCHLPSKAVTETKRRENRERNRKKAKELLREGKIREAKECFQRCVDVTSEMAANVINACRARNVDVIVAPYEADAQLAYLNLSGVVQLVITEDSDLILFGSKAILFKMDNNGGGILVEQEKLHLGMNLPRDKFSFDKFRIMCILSGCDYLPSLHGIGLTKACKFINVTSNPDIHNALCKLPMYLKMPQLEVTKEYRDGFVNALNTFLYQLVFDPISRTLRPLIDYPDDKGPEDFPYAGKFIGHERALQIALGNVNVQTGEVVGNFDPETYKPPKPKSSGWNKHGDIRAAHPSIWTKSFTKKEPMVPSIFRSERRTTKGKEITVATPLFKRKKPEPEVLENDLTEGELHDLYSLPEKSRRVEASPDDTDNSLNDSGIHSTLDQLSDPLVAEEDTDKSVIARGDNNNDTFLDEKYTSSPETHKSKNPFAKSQTISKSQGTPNGHFSALKKFSKIKRTLMDQNTITYSRYFASPAVQTSAMGHDNSHVINKSHAEEEEAAKPECQSRVSALADKDTLEHKLHVDDSPTKSTKVPLSPVRTNTLPNKSENNFHWGKMSERFAHTNKERIKVERSPAAMTKFKPVAQRKIEVSKSKENNLVSSQSSDSEESSLSQRSHLSTVSLFSDVDSIDNESFGLTPSSIPSTPDGSTPFVVKEAVASPALPRHTFAQKTKLSALISKNKCRAPGLSRSSKKNKMKKQLHTKQLDLRDMFGFKKDGTKLQVPRLTL
ncbi:exonuclease 1-like isoform X2 [Homarus americanus]|nr:exonuclease 1-like isoform X2 [Homarus americanus]